MYLKKIILATVLLFGIFTFLPTDEAQAQDKIEITDQDYKNQEVEMADKLRSEGKIYIVVASLSVILIGVFIYLFIIEKKIGKLEKEFSQN